MAFPRDRYSPFGYLANPAARAFSWREGEGGSLCATRPEPGFGWHYPWARDATARAGLAFVLRLGDRWLRTRADFDGAGIDLYSAHHGARLFSYNLAGVGSTGQVRLALADPHTLVCAAELGPGAAVALELRPFAEREGQPVAPWQDGERRRFDLGDQAPPHAVVLKDDGRRVRAALARGEAIQTAGDALGVVEQTLARAQAADDAFWAGAARLEGDWPDAWRRGWVVDIETTRLCLFPAGGQFHDVWPAWMVQWPRAVLAENCLDMQRLAYAAPALAQRALLTLFRDSAVPNVPCVFQGGEPNMVAADGTVCGTSPAWCLPFYNLWLLYLRAPDKAWLRQLYPYLAAYLRFWLTERADQEGWLSYVCTWEAGEDDNPRLDPLRRGDGLIFGRTRPVELQAAMALSAGILAFFARELGADGHEMNQWLRVAGDYRDRLHRLWDRATGRFRDWDVGRGAFIEPSGVADYGGIDPCRYSALALSPSLRKLATPAQARALRAELRHYAGPPWCEWPSWSFVVSEAARWAGEPQFAAEMAQGIVARMYADLDRRHADSGPLPGVAREYWPLHMAEFGGCEGYGWGANTAMLLMRHIFGCLEDFAPQRQALRLAPHLPAELLRPGKRYAVANLPYRGEQIDTSYQVRVDGLLDATVAIRGGPVRRARLANGDERLVRWA